MISSARVELLDHGYIELIESWGSDERIIEAARMSTGKGFQGWGPIRERCDCGDGTEYVPCDAFNPTGKRQCTKCNGTTYREKPGDEKLLRYLWENAHHSPFEMTGAIFEIKAPIFVFREWHRHRTQSYNEMSARYVPLPDENYVPTVERILTLSEKNRQSSAIASSEQINADTARLAQNKIKKLYTDAQIEYDDLLKLGVPKEIARVVLPVGRYSKMRASALLRNWLAFLTLREAPSAQWEIRQYADALHVLLKDKFPRTMALFEEKPLG